MQAVNASKHTERPWRAHESDGGCDIDIDAGEQRICSLSLDGAREAVPPIPDEEVWTNARLIEEAPKMLEVLRGLLHELDAEMPKYASARKAQARAILARIEGES